jgi:hypothetical protein
MAPPADTSAVAAGAPKKESDGMVARTEAQLIPCCQTNKTGKA